MISSTGWIGTLAKSGDSGLWRAGGPAPARRGPGCVLALRRPDHELRARHDPERGRWVLLDRVDVLLPEVECEPGVDQSLSEAGTSTWWFLRPSATHVAAATGQGWALPGDGAVRRGLRVDPDVRAPDPGVLADAHDEPGPRRRRGGPPTQTPARPEQVPDSASTPPPASGGSSRGSTRRVDGDVDPRAGRQHRGRRIRSGGCRSTWRQMVCGWPASTISGAPSAPYSPRIHPGPARIRVVVGEPHPVGASSAKPMPSR